MISRKCLLLSLAIAIAIPLHVDARGSRSPNDPAVGALLAAYIREKHCGKKMPRSGLRELERDALPYNADPSVLGAFAKDMRKRAEAAYRSMPASSQKKSSLCPYMEKELSRWLVDKIKNPDRYK